MIYSSKVFYAEKGCNVPVSSIIFMRMFNGIILYYRAVIEVSITLWYGVYCQDMR